jgi:hypothetical protein
MKAVKLIIGVGVLGAVAVGAYLFFNKTQPIVKTEEEIKIETELAEESVKKEVDLEKAKVLVSEIYKLGREIDTAKGLSKIKVINTNTPIISKKKKELLSLGYIYVSGGGMTPKVV